jgi:hypothetical protein
VLNALNWLIHTTDNAQSEIPGTSVLTPLGTEVLADFWSDAHPEDRAVDCTVGAALYTGQIWRNTESTFKEHIHDIRHDNSNSRQNMQNTSIKRSTNTENGKDYGLRLIEEYE